MYPRLYRLGLIEAARKAPSTKPVWWGIRGFIASASLKQSKNFGFIAAICKRYPRLYRLGLIEAFHPIPRQGRDIAAGIRGFIASASLKRCSVNCRLSRRGCIRGFIASASLKRDQRPTSPSSKNPYPRLYRLGLIEAPAFSIGAAPVPSVSEALSPRPH